jgi:hypothetical protein
MSYNIIILNSITKRNKPVELVWCEIILLEVIVYYEAGIIRDHHQSHQWVVVIVWYLDLQLSM